jgi:hypothetical protein
MKTPRKLHTILIFDDEEDILIVAKDALDFNPEYKITCANSGKEGMKNYFKQSIIAFITKPFYPIDLPNIVQDIWRKLQASRA